MVPNRPVVVGPVASAHFVARALPVPGGPAGHRAERRGDRSFREQTCTFRERGARATSDSPRHPETREWGSQGPSTAALSPGLPAARDLHRRRLLAAVEDLVDVLDGVGEDLEEEPLLLVRDEGAARYVVQRDTERLTSTDRTSMPIGLIESRVGGRSASPLNERDGSDAHWRRRPRAASLGRRSLADEEQREPRAGRVKALRCEGAPHIEASVGGGRKRGAPHRPARNRSGITLVSRRTTGCATGSTISAAGFST